MALVGAGRGLPGGSTLARFLAEHRGARHLFSPPPLALPQVLAWGDAFLARHGRWPHRNRGKIPESQGESWFAVHRALQTGTRGLPRHSSLLAFFEEHRGHSRRRSTEQQILAWADAWHARTGRWPSLQSGEIPESGGMKWCKIDSILRTGRRHFPGGSSLARLSRRQPRHGSPSSTLSRADSGLGRITSKPHRALASLHLGTRLRGTQRELGGHRLGAERRYSRPAGGLVTRTTAQHPAQQRWNRSIGEIGQRPPECSAHASAPPPH